MDDALVGVSEYLRVGHLTDKEAVAAARGGPEGIGWCTFDGLSSSREIERKFSPKMNARAAREKYSGWCKAVADLERNSKK